MTYPNYMYPAYQPNMYQPQQLPQQQMQIPQQMQSGGFLSVRNEQEARSYPVAPGNVMTFKIENQPYVCEKSQGFSQLEGPVFNKYRLVKEDEIPEQEPVKPSIVEGLQQEVDNLKEEIRLLKERVYSKPKILENIDSRDLNKNKGDHKND